MGEASRKTSNANHQPLRDTMVTSPSDRKNSFTSNIHLFHADHRKTFVFLHINLIELFWVMQYPTLIPHLLYLQ